MSPLVPIVPIVVAVIVIAVIAIIVRRTRRSPSIEPDRQRLFEIQNEWHAPAELLSSPLPRPVQLSTQGKVALGFGAVFLIGGAFMTVLAVRAMSAAQERQRLIQEQGVDTQAQIIRKWITTGSKNSKSYRVSYRFAADGRVYQRQTTLRRSDYDSISVGQSVPVRYVPANPGLSRLSLETSSVPVWISIIPPAFVVLMLLLLLEPILSQRKLLLWGTPVGAMVTHLATVKGGKVVRYEFLDGAGNIVTGSYTVNKPAVPEVGAVVTVLHDPDHTGRNVLYPPQLVKIKPQFG